MLSAAQAAQKIQMQTAIAADQLSAAQAAQKALPQPQLLHLVLSAAQAAQKLSLDLFDQSNTALRRTGGSENSTKGHAGRPKALRRTGGSEIRYHK